MNSSSSFGSWIHYVRPNDRARLRLFCFAYAGGAASIFRPWRDVLAQEIEVFPVQLPGRESRIAEPPFTQLTLCVEALSEAIRPLLTKPFAFFGHSMGALLSFELARQMRREQTATPVHLLISGCRAPQVPDPDPPIHRLPDPQFLEEIYNLKGTPREVLAHAELMHLLLPRLRADFTLCETYRYIPEEPLACPISVFGGLQDHKVCQSHLEAWREQTTSSFRLRMFPGDHFFLHSLREPFSQAIACDLTRHL